MTQFAVSLAAAHCSPDGPPASHMLRATIWAREECNHALAACRGEAAVTLWA